MCVFATLSAFAGAMLRASPRPVLLRSLLPRPRGQACPPLLQRRYSDAASAPVAEEFADCVLCAVGGGGEVVLSTTGLPSPAEVDALCTSVGWPHRPPKRVQAALAGSYLVATLRLHQAVGLEAAGAARDLQQQQPPPRLVGLARATSDGVFTAVVWDVLVEPALQRRGLGRALVAELTRRLTVRGIPTVALFSDARTVAFYRELGFAECARRRVSGREEGEGGGRSRS